MANKDDYVKALWSEFMKLVALRHANVSGYVGACFEDPLVRCLCNQRSPVVAPAHTLLLQPFIVLEFASNGSLYDFAIDGIQKRTVNKLSWAQKVRIAIGAARGMQYLHSRNVLHRGTMLNDS